MNFVIKLFISSLFFMPSILISDVYFGVCRCNDYVKASKRLTIKQAPNILTIALKRFQVGSLLSCLLW